MVPSIHVIYVLDYDSDDDSFAAFLIHQPKPFLKCGSKDERGSLAFYLVFSFYSFDSRSNQV